MVKALLLLWNDIEEGRTDEYERWHTLEHVPERVWVPGYVSGTRYASVDGGFRKYFTVYELENLASLASSEYQDLVEKPTPWSTSMRPSFSGFLRKTGMVVASAGNSLGSVACAVRMVWNDGAKLTKPIVQTLAERILRSGAAHHVSRCRFMQVQTVGPQALANVDAAPSGLEYICLVEAFSTRSLALLASTVRSALGVETIPAPIWSHESHYALSSSVRHSDVAGSVRPQPRLDLMPVKE
jgi:hypothetical protein